MLNKSSSSLSIDSLWEALKLKSEITRCKSPWIGRMGVLPVEDAEDLEAPYLESVQVLPRIPYKVIIDFNSEWLKTQTFPILVLVLEREPSGDIYLVSPSCYTPKPFLQPNNPRFQIPNDLQLWDYFQFGYTPGWEDFIAIILPGKSVEDLHIPWLTQVMSKKFKPVAALTQEKLYSLAAALPVNPIIIYSWVKLTIE